MYSYLQTYWRILLRRMPTILTVACTLTALVAIVSFKMRPVYQATARLEVEAEAPQIQSLDDLRRQAPGDDAFLGTQIQILETDDLAWRTIEQLGLQENPGFASPEQVEAHSDARNPNVLKDWLVRKFRKALNVERVRESRVVKVNFESTNADMAAQVANALATNYIEYNFHQRYDATRQASGWMEQQLDELKAKVEKSQQELVDYQRQNAIVNIDDKQDVLEERLADLSKQLTAAESDFAQQQSLYQLVKSDPAHVAMLAENELLEKLQEKYADIQGQYIDAMGTYGPNYPKVGRLKAQVTELQNFIDLERQRTVERVQHDYLAASGRRELLAGAVAQEKVELGKLSQLLIRHNILKREFETNQQLYNSLLQRLKDATVSAGLRATNIHIIDPPSTPVVPIRPKKLLNTAIGLLVGLILGVTLAFVQEGLDNSIKTAEDAERLVAVPSLATIPLGPSPRRPRVTGRGQRNGKVLGEGTLGLTVLRHPSSTLAEAFRTLRTSVLLSTSPRPPECVLVTSAQAGEGKTSTALNLATAFAQQGDRVLIIDGDLRRPAITTALELPNDKGLSGFLTGAHSLHEALRQVDPQLPLWVLPAGPVAPNPAELLSSATMRSVLRELRRRFRYVLVDSPPLLVVTDATILSTLVDGVLLVIESESTARGAVVRARRLLESAGARVLGVVMNKVNLRHDGYYGYSYRRYYQPYGSPPNTPPNAQVSTVAASS
jgi:capsular exopolysaccharide synthesis family protein